MASTDFVTRGALAALTGCNAETIRYYERAGVMPEPRRSAGGHRLYGPEDVRRLRFARRCRELGFSLVEIRGLLRLVDRGERNCGTVRDLTLAHVADIRRRIADLRRMERVLRDMAAGCEGGDVPDCPILDALAAGD